MALSEEAKKLGNRSAFPYELSPNGQHTGMTYRRWLVGQALAGGVDAEDAVEEADAALEALAAEDE